MPDTSLCRSKARSYGLASILALGFAMVASVPACLDSQGSGPSGRPDGGAACTPGDETDGSSGDCVKMACVDGVLQTVADDDDMPDDGKDCTVDSCEGTTPTHVNKPAGESCGMGSSCDGVGNCTCASDADCGENTECRTFTCDKVCKSTNAPAGTKLTAGQTDGDCKVLQCNSSGGIEEVLDAKDPQSDGNDCTVDTCVNGAPVYTPDPAVKVCVTQDNPTGTGKCDAEGKCLGCTQTSECGSGPPWYTCDETVNVCFRCDDGVKNGTETDVDCGGECIDRCGLGKACKVTADCAEACDNGVCVSCFDGVKNGGEGDVDCGGICADKCGTNQSCNVPADCTSGVCTGNKCIAPSCSDGVANGTETDVDCGGGGGCPKCGPGKKCNGGGDCLNSCVEGTCN
ncbi:hypothetical protein [Polyangium spumosum]|uniref:Tryptophan synthase alpha chain n=1 Tax=Polyangium spumosum TaxID=889282 RepID=A0A6N7PGY6_9BACT|nr:hypothetical protein [Polyangium spumosum]MRG91259.1 hypothetical protein [Polyangium spumosum]